MSEPFTFDNVVPSDTNDFEELPAGTYNVQVEECVAGTSSKGTPELRVQFRVIDGEHKNRVISDWLYFNQNTQEIILNKLLAANVKPPTGIKTADQAPARVAGILEGAVTQVVVRPDTYNGETRNKVKSWKKAPQEIAGQTAMAGVATSTAVGGDDDIPF